MSRRTQQARTLRDKRHTNRQMFVGFALVICFGGVLCGFRLRSGQEQTARFSQEPRYMSYEDLIKRPTAEIAKMDMAEVNLVCSQGIEQKDELLDLNSFSAKLDEIAQRVKSETERHLYRFRQNPARFDNSEGKFRMEMMGVVLWEDFHVRYNAEQASTYKTATDAEFLSDSRTAFIRGPMDPNIGGNCGSLPVLYAAVGRRLGYPLLLVNSQYHLYLRWAGSKEQFNIEVATERGVNFYDDEHYRQIDRAINGTENYTDAQAKAEGFFRPLTPREEIANAFRQRAQCMQAKGRLMPATHAAMMMVDLSPSPARNLYHAQLMRAMVHELDEKAKHAVPVPTADQNPSIILP